MFNFGFDPEQFASLGSSFDEPDPFAPEPLASVAQPALINPARSDYYVLDNKPKPAAVAPTSFVPDVFSSNSGASFTAEDAQAEKDSPTVFQSGFGAYAKPDTKQNDYSGRTNLAEFHDTAYSAMQNNDAGYESNRPNPFTGDINLQAYQGSYIAPVVRELKEGGYTAFQKQEEGAITKEQVAQGIMDNMRGAYVADNPITQDFLDNPTFDATKLYMNTGGQTAFNMAISDEDPNAWRERDKKGKYVDISGGRSKFGDYSMVWVENPKGPSGLDKALNNPVINIAASLIPGGTLALTAAKAANGQTLHGMDYASAALSGFELSKTLQAPVDAAKAAEVGRAAADASVAAGKTSFEAMTNAAFKAEASALAGKGFKILGKELSYAASKGLINAVAVGDPKAAILGTFGGELVAKGLEKVGIGGLNPDGTAITSWKGIQIDDLSAGLTRAVEEVGNGRDVDEALAMGLGKYIREGGTLGAGTADTLTKVVRDVVRPIGAAATDLYKLVEGAIPKGTDVNLDKVKEVFSEANRLARQGASATDTLARKGLSEIDDEFIQPITKPAGMLLSAADTLARKGLSEIDDRVINPAGDLLSEADTLARKGFSAFDDAVIQPTGEFLSAVDTAARQELTKLDEGLYDVQSPFSTPHFNSLDGPEIDIDIDLPSFNFDSSRKGMLSGATTGKIFGDELFKFKNNIELTEFGPMFVEKEQEVDIEEFLTSPFESAFTSSERFA